MHRLARSHRDVVRLDGMAGPEPELAGAGRSGSHWESRSDAGLFALGLLRLPPPPPQPPALSLAWRQPELAKTTGRRGAAPARNLAPLPTQLCCSEPGGGVGVGPRPGCCKGGKRKLAAAGDKYRQPGWGAASRLCLLQALRRLHVPERPAPSLARMSLRVLLLLAAVLCLCQAQGSENQASDCCLSHKNHPIPIKVLSSYRLQGPETGCRLPAIVFVTKKNKSLCAPPKAKWAQDLMVKLEQLKAQPGKQPRRKGTKPRKQRKPQQ